MKRIVAGFLVLFLLFAGGCGLLNKLGGDTREMNLVSYNIHHCAGADGKVDIQRVADVIAREQPDFVGLNEVDRKTKRVEGVDEAGELGKRLGLHATFAEAIPLTGGSYGNAVLSREKPISVSRIPLPGREKRVLLMCEFDDCWFGTTHLSLQETNRVASAEIIRKFVTEKAKEKTVFLSGDWNAVPESKPLTAIREFMRVVSDESKGTFNGFKKKSPHKGKCIDYIAVDKNSAKNVEVKATHVREDAMTSDHNLISVKLVIRSAK
jgi:endonuclease/exonuclease/phosphatase family metal-dependent hydrolase